MAISSPSTKLLAVVHVGFLSGVVRNASQTPQQEPINNEYELLGAALDVCRQMMTETAWTSEVHKVKVTGDAVDDDRGTFESLTLVQSSTLCTVSSGTTTGLVPFVGSCHNVSSKFTE